MIEKEPRLSRPKEDSAHEMGNMRWSSGQCGYSWGWLDRSYGIATQSGMDDVPTMVAGTHSFARIGGFFLFFLLIEYTTARFQQLRKH